MWEETKADRKQRRNILKSTKIKLEQMKKN